MFRIIFIPCFLSVLSVIIIFLCLQFETAAPLIVGDAMQPRSFPIFLMVINLLLIGVLQFQFFRKPPSVLKPETKQTWITISLFPLFYLVTIIDLFIGIFVVMFIMGYVWGQKNIIINLVNSLLTPAIIFFIFDFFLKVRFPRGLLTNLYYG